jgi:glyoxylase-like metal-dependent hydrolase (beta-lactamase superfamily II)
VNGLQQVTTRALRLLAPNPGPMTLDGTNTWVLREPGETGCVVVDPGPADDAHLARIAEHGPVRLIVLTHGHADHSEGAAPLHALPGAPVVARDPQWCIDVEPLTPGRAAPVEGVEWLTVLTPGHSSDSICLLLPADRALLTGDTVLGRGTTVVAHPDGRLGDYLDSLQRLRDLAASDIDVLLPGHGPVLDAPVDVLDGYLRHRTERLEQVRAAVAAGDGDAAAVVRRVYADVDPVLWPAAELSVRAQLDYLRLAPTSGVDAAR